MYEQSEIRSRMSAVRRRGLANAHQLAEQVEKLSDWREHVRAHPLPMALAVAGLAFWAVPTRTSPREQVRSRDQQTSVSGSFTPKARESVDDKSAKTSGLVGAAMGFVGSLVGNAVRSYVAEQVQTLITSRGNNATPEQRQAPYARF